MNRIIIWAGIILFLTAGFVFAEEITLTTYYPAPFGVYDQMVTDTLGVGDNDGVSGLTGDDAPTTSGDVWIAGNVGIGTRDLSKGLLNVKTGTGTAIYGSSVDSYGINGKSTNSCGVNGNSINFYGVRGFSSKSIGVYGSSTDEYGVYGNSQNSYGVYGNSQNSYGVYGNSTNSSGVRGFSTNSFGVHGRSTNSEGVRGVSSDDYGVYGISTNSSGVRGFSTNSSGVYGRSWDSYGVYGRSNTSYAGYFLGDVYVTGTLTAVTKPFVQPHPDDPQKEFVYVSMEGRDVRIFFDGVGKLKQGRAVIEIPDDFRLIASAKQPFNVILTPFGDAQLYVKQRSTENVWVRSRERGADIEFGYMIIATRGGFEDAKPVQKNTHFRPDKDTSITEFEQRFAAKEKDSHYSKLGKELNRKILIKNGVLTAEGKVNQELIQSLDWEYRENAVSDGGE